MEAMDKIRDEMAKSQNPAVQELGETLTAWLSRHPEGAEKILAEGKTLQGSYKALEEYARKNKNGNSACVPYMKAVEIMAEYWGIDKEEMTRAAYARMLEEMGAAGGPPGSHQGSRRPGEDCRTGEDAEAAGRGAGHGAGQAPGSGEGNTGGGAAGAGAAAGPGWTGPERDGTAGRI
jgi:hypothetical protein